VPIYSSVGNLDKLVFLKCGVADIAAFQLLLTTTHCIYAVTVYVT